MRKAVFVAAMALFFSPAWEARATVSQIDGTIVPTTNSLQNELETDEGVSDPNDPNYLDATRDAYVFPQIFMPPGCGTNQVVTFTDVQEQAGFENTFGWYNVDDPTTLYRVFVCSDEPDTTKQVDFCEEQNQGRWHGGFIGFFLITPEGNTSDPHVNCGDFDPPDRLGHLYYTESELNGDGDYVHFLVYTSKVQENRFYFAFEDLFRGGDNDFTDMTIQVEGLTPPCVPEPEICDGLDNDCDGETDEDPVDAGGPCGTDVGECQPGTLVCVDAGLVCQGAVGPSPETCDGLDNDCDNETDEDPIDEGNPCGRSTGECSPGTTQCQNGSLVCVGEIGPSPEICDGFDNDCNGTVDDNLTDEGQVCGTNNGECHTGLTVCVNGGLVCQGAVEPTPEVCDGLDNDCDNETDESPVDAGGPCGTDVGECSRGTKVCIDHVLVCQGAVGPTAEVCDGYDNDCNGAIDDNPTDAGGSCGTNDGECQAGQLVCSGGELVCQGAVGPTAEVCDGLDNDCDNETDESPIDAGDPCGTDEGECSPGTMVCVNGALVCQGAVGPTAEVCDGYDNDCNGAIDDNPIDEGGVCGTSEGECSPGQYECVGGNLICNGAVGPQDEICDGRDNDCDGDIDEDDPGGGATCGISDQGECRLGVIHCVAGQLTCDGAIGPRTEDCDCLDNDCDGDIDEDAVCPPGSQCLDCECRITCREGEFQCPGGMSCQDGYCIPTPCYGVDCPEGQVCRDGDCVDVCSLIHCDDNETCVDGRCVENNCYGLGCPEGQICRNAQCSDDPCADVTCGERQFCREGQCIDTCEHVVCPEGQSCKDGRCEPDPCLDIDCDWGTRCRDGRCEPDPCQGVTCGADRVCKDGDCIDDPCSGVTCPLGGVCEDGQCRDPDGYIPGVAGKKVMATGVGGCSCQTEGGRDSGLVWMLLVGIALFFSRRKQVTQSRLASRKPTRRGMLLGLAFIVPLLLASSGCRFDPYQFADIDGYMPTNPDGGPNRVDSGQCEPTNGGVELCDEIDNDCDGLTDEDFDLNTDQEHCGSCDTSCIRPGAFTACMDGSCVFYGCAPGAYDLDGDPGNGCEYECLPSAGGEELCDEIDNDCDGQTDEDFDLDTDDDNCGACGHRCALTNADTFCQNGQCHILSCHEGFLDINGIEGDGCEYPCSPTNGGVEICDGIDNDCNGHIDDGVDVSDDPDNCGACGQSCSMPHADTTCQGGRCVLVECHDGHVNLDGDLGNGCEYPCSPTNAGVEICDGIDNDCNGIADDNLTDVGGSCGSDQGACSHGQWVCSAGVLQCSGGVGPQPETCDSIDNDCDGETDNAPIEMGGPCGTDEGTCQFGTLVCVDGQPECQGGIVPQPETCDGLDNDCDGTPDNNLTDTGTVCGSNVGACQTGTLTCSSGHLVCSGSIDPLPEICDGVDNDCDGQTDEDTFDTGDLCGTNTGDCQVGVTVCENGQVVCQGDIEPQVEVCDGHDNDCDGIADNNLTDTGGQCGVTDVGPCQYGSWQCQDGHLECHGNIDPQPEVCDGIDNDCDTNPDPSGCVTSDATDIRLDASSNPGAANSIQVDMAAMGDEIHVVWLDTRNGNADIYHTCSTDGGQTWSTDTRLDSGSSDSVKPRVIMDSAGWVYVVWADFRTGTDRDVYLRRSAGCGQSFDSELRLDTGNVDSLNLDLAADGSGHVYVVWEDFIEGSGTTPAQRNVYLAASSDFGATFAAATRVNQQPADPADAYATLPRVAIGASNRVLITWADARNGALDIYLNESDDSGSTFFPGDLRLDTDLAGNAASKYPRIVADAQGHVYVVWQDLRRGSYSDIYMNRSSDNGNTWLSADQRLDTDKGDADSFAPLLVLGQGSALHVAWQDWREGLPIVQVASSYDNGATFTSVRASSETAGLVSEIRLDAAAGKVFVLWADDRDGLRDIYLNFSLDSGLNFQPDDIRLDQDPAGAAESFSPLLGADGQGGAYGVWVDTRADDIHGDIFFNSVSE